MHDQDCKEAKLLAAEATIAAQAQEIAEFRSLLQSVNEVALRLRADNKRMEDVLRFLRTRVPVDVQRAERRVERG